MSLVTPTINYSDRDFETIRAAMVAAVRTRFPNDWKDFTESSIGMAWLELAAFAFDNLSFNLDEMVRQSFLPTATDREAVILLCRLVGYKLRPPTSASVECRATIAAVQSVDVIVRAGLTVTTESGVVFQVLESQAIPAGQTTAEITLAEGETQVDSVVSNGETFQEFRLQNAPVIDASIKVRVDGFEWTESESLVYADAASTNFQVRYDMEDQAYVKFGDGTSGAVPPNGADIEITYRVGGGVRGNIAIGDIVNQTVAGLLDGSSPEEFVNVLLSNLERGAGGEERESIDSAKFWAPRMVSTNGRAVTQQDFDTLASRFNDPVYGSPAYAKARLRQRVPEYNLVDIFVWARDGYGTIVPPSDNLKDAIQAYFDNNGEGAVRIITVDVEVQDGDNVYVDVDVQVTADGTRSNSEVQLDVQQAIRSYFSLASNQPGTAIRLSRLYHLIQTTNGVMHALIRRVTASRLTSETIGASNGVIQQYDYTTFDQPLAGTVVITSEGHEIRDDGNGGLTGDIDDGFANTIDYATGEINFAFATPVPSNGEAVRIEYRTPLEFQRSQTGLATGNGVTRRFRGQLATFPIVPGSVAFSDGLQTATDDEDGNLVGDDLDPLATHSIDYDTGVFDLTFVNAPAESRSLSANYRQLLSVNAGDVPIEEHQLAIAGFQTVAVSSES